MELYVAALEALEVHGPMNVTRMTLKVKVNGGPLKRILDDLTEKELVEQKTLKSMKLYAATTKTKTVLSHLKELSLLLPIAEIQTASCRIGS